MRRLWVTVLVTGGLLNPLVSRAEDLLREDARAALTRATRFFREKVARHGGYQYMYSEDLTRSLGEIRRGAETAVTVQPPGTPSVAMVFLEAYEATGDRVHLDAALRAGTCLLEGQLRSGGWSYGVEYDAELRGTHAYRLEPEAPDQDNLTVLDDNTTQFALRFFMRLDEVLGFADEAIHEAVRYGLDSVLKAQYSNGAWPQRYDRFPEGVKHPVKKASCPADWSRSWPGPHYKRHYTFNDDTIADVISMLFEAARVYGDERFRVAARKGADFILLAQLPEPQPAWAQQYDFDMHPSWARRFEPPAVSGRESQDVMLTLLEVYRETGESRYLDPLPPATAYLRRSRLDDGRLARFYEMETNRPLYFTRDYELTYDDGDLPTHYSFKVPDRLDGIEAEYERLRALGSGAVAKSPANGRPIEELRDLVRKAIAELDDEGRWLEKGAIPGPGSPPDPNARVIRSGTFVRYARVLCAFLEATADSAGGESGGAAS
jgi:PelA/Pel-15E family pectate lyase